MDAALSATRTAHAAELENMEKRFERERLHHAERLKDEEAAGKSVLNASQAAVESGRAKLQDAEKRLADVE